MNSKGFISIQYLFSIFLVILILIFILFIAFNSIGSEQSIERHLNYRTVLDTVSDSINQVSSNGEGYSKEIALPKMEGTSYSIKVSKNNVIFKGGGRTAKNSIMPVVPVSHNVKVDEIELYEGYAYIIRMHEDSRISIESRGWG